VIVFVDVHRARFGVAPICRALSQHGVPIAPSTYYAARSRPRSARSIADESMLSEITRVHSNPVVGRGLIGLEGVAPAAPRGHPGCPLLRGAVDANRWP